MDGCFHAFYFDSYLFGNRSDACFLSGIHQRMEQEQKMINISVKHNEDTCSIVMDGHAGYAVAGSDIICAAVSALYLNLMNSIEELSEASGCEYMHGDSHLYCINDLDGVADAFVNAFKSSCRSIAEENPKYVRYRDV